MGHRLSRIITRTGDAGTTGLGDGSRVSKHSPRIHALGEVDELNCIVGLIRCEPLAAEVDALLAEVQHDLFDLGSELAVPGYQALQETQLAMLEQQAASWNETLPMLKEFILPGGCKAAALAHQARAVCRRAERSVVALDEVEPGLPALPRQYLNRLSDVLFILTRVLNAAAGVSDVLWQPRRLQQSD
ncbi:cob(I)yrinic acid a,c-diamide adenosyltransferase [Vogesella amnigena]|uniref:Cobalamin adenosyltransferase n=1 Tax=Vogesella amnigena TaxID=1507449 RepID=A0ABV7TY72_9NEIS